MMQTFLQTEGHKGLFLFRGTSALQTLNTLESLGILLKCSIGCSRYTRGLSFRISNILDDPDMSGL